MNDRNLKFAALGGSTWFALSGPANMPREIVDRLNAEVVKILHASDLQARFAREAIDTKSLDADAFTAYFKAKRRAGRRLRARSPTR
jgi:tripartite-type tricarboxylate transporter receptor subunit TctC